MPYVSANYSKHPKAPQRHWICAPASALGPFDEVPTGSLVQAPNYCGQCVSYVKQVCPTLPATAGWKRGQAVKGDTRILAGTVIATFNDAGQYEGHAAIYVSQSPAGILVYDQYRTPRNPKPIGPRTLKWGGIGNANNGDNYHVVE